ncbi:hypothetical protein G8S21_03610 [Clostridium botulinum C]|uniref:ATP-binding protein n=1 Tax=Clostridium botulinum TaxID=1491 RepID=UPI001E4C40B0|nr:ATP-binding protein [Clostridium botulinum]MCD3245036.1 hypothetical protein [Clostridium botulinum C]MCD3261405.1 hypothetical protein [Clostridium botulinum C]
MDKKNKVVISKAFLKKELSEDEHIAKSLSRFIDNSIKAREKIIINKDPCRVYINILEDSIVISDNSGGIDSSITDKDIFKIGNDNKNEILGLGIKKSLFRLGNKIDIFSNKKGCARKFSLDIKLGNEELVSQSEDINYDPDVPEGTIVVISDLEGEIKKKIIKFGFLNDVILKLGRMYSKFIDKEKLIIQLNDIYIKPKNIEAKKINSCLILDNCKVELYKGNKYDISGIDLFINDYMVYDRVKTKEVKWNLLNEAKHTYTDCIIEIVYYGDKSEFMKNKEDIFNEVIDFVKKNKINFRSNVITIQYEASISKVEELKQYYNENTAKAIGIKGFNKLYEHYINTRYRD